MTPARSTSTSRPRADRSSLRVPRIPSIRRCRSTPPTPASAVAGDALSGRVETGGPAQGHPRLRHCSTRGAPTLYRLRPLRTVRGRPLVAAPVRPVVEATRLVPAADDRGRCHRMSAAASSRHAAAPINVIRLEGTEESVASPEGCYSQPPPPGADAGSSSTRSSSTHLPGSRLGCGAMLRNRRGCAGDLHSGSYGGVHNPSTPSQIIAPSKVPTAILIPCSTRLSTNRTVTSRDGRPAVDEEAYPVRLVSPRRLGLFGPGASGLGHPRSQLIWGASRARFENDHPLERMPSPPGLCRRPPDGREVAALSWSSPPRHVASIIGPSAYLTRRTPAPGPPPGAGSRVAGPVYRREGGSSPCGDFESTSLPVCFRFTQPHEAPTPARIALLGNY